MPAVAARKGRALLIPHGGGPLVHKDPSQQTLAKWLQEFPKTLPKFSSIVIISAHWEERVPTVSSGANPSMLYDYSGFPKEAYELKYPAPGNPALASKISKLLTEAGISNGQDANRGFDHGVFLPLMLMYPLADVPVVQLSLSSSLDASLHIKIGHALTPLLDEDVLILGSGFTFHNIRAIFGPAAERKAPNESFEAWLKETCTSEALTEADRTDRYANWSKAPGARFCHPREEHLLPLHVCFGAAGGGAALQVFNDTVMEPSQNNRIEIWSKKLSSARHMLRFVGSSQLTSSISRVTAAPVACLTLAGTQTRAMYGKPTRKTNVRMQHNARWFAQTKNHMLSGKESINTLDRPPFPQHAEDVDRPLVVPDDARCFHCNKDIHSHTNMMNYVWIPSGNASVPTPQGYFFCKSCFKCDKCKFRFMHNKFYTVKDRAWCVSCALGREIRVPTRRWHDSFVAGHSLSSRVTGQSFPRYKHELEFLYNPEK